MTVDVDALLAGTIRVGRTRIVVYDDVELVIHELPAGTIWAHSDAVMREVRSEEQVDSTVSTRRMTGMVARFLKGPGFEPTEEQITHLIDSMGEGLLSKVYLDGMNFNGRNLPEDALKKD